MKESRYVRLADTMFRVLKHASRIPLFLHKKSNHHIFTVRQHIVVLLALRQYENKSYRMFCRMVNRSLLTQNIYEVITYFTTLYYSSKVYLENKWYIIIVEDNFLIHIVS